MKEQPTFYEYIIHICRQSEGSAKVYAFEVNNYLAHHPEAAFYDYKQVMAYITEITRKYPNHGSQNRILSAIKKYYAYLCDTGMREDNPIASFIFERRGRKQIQLQDLLSPDELETLARLRTERYEILKLRNRILISLLIYQGLAAGEIAALKTSDIDLINGTVHIKRSRRLNGRTLSLKDHQRYFIEEYMEEIRPGKMKHATLALLLGKRGEPISAEDVHAVIETLKELIPEKPLTPKTIRMSVISNWLNVYHFPIEQVQQMAGHKWPSSTQQYIRPDLAGKRAWINKFHPIR